MAEAAAAAIAASRIAEHLAVVEAMATPEWHTRIASAAAALVASLRAGSPLLWFGNGGSAADAQHFAAEFVGRFRLERAALPAIALTTNTSAITAIANDYAYDRVFARQVEAFGRPEGAAIGLSTSGRSINVADGLEAARRLGMTTIALTGAECGPVSEAADHWLGAPSRDTARIQEAHAIIGHVLCELAERELQVDRSP